MSQLYTSQPTVNRLLTIFSSLFHSATRPTRHLLAWLLIAQLALESASSVRCLFRQFLSKQTDASLNSYYRALGNGLVTDASIPPGLDAASACHSAGGATAGAYPAQCG